MTSYSQGSLLCRAGSGDLDPGGQVILRGSSGGGVYIEDCEEMKALFSSDRPHYSYLREHCCPHSHRGYWIYSHQFLWLLRSLQREQMYDRDGKALLGH